MGKTVRRYEKGDHVSYMNSGVCLVDDICSQEVLGGGLFYLLRPLAHPKATIFIPVDNEQLVSRMDPVPDREEIDRMIGEAKSSRIEWIPDRKARVEMFRPILRECGTVDLLRLSDCIYRQKDTLADQGKKLSATDEGILSQAERMIENLFGYALQVEGEQVRSYLNAAFRGV